MQKLILALTCFLFFLNTATAQIGYSGMTKIGKTKYLVVLDTKSFQDEERVALVTINEDGISVDKLKIKDWKHKQGKASDLESVCDVPCTKDEYLLVESGYWNGKFGRIFHVKLKDEKLKVLEVYKLPGISPGGKDNPNGDNFEGVACVKNGKNLYVIIGERGGTTRFPNGLLRIGILNKKKDKIDWQTYADYTVEAILPKSVDKPLAMRTITDLYLEDDGRLFAAAAVDDSDIGPFKSVVYELGRVSFSKGKLKIKQSKNKHVYTLDGFKVEALSKSPDFMLNSTLCIGTEDEVFGGQWRALYSN